MLNTTYVHTHVRGRGESQPQYSMFTELRSRNAAGRARTKSVSGSSRAVSLGVKSRRGLQNKAVNAQTDVLSKKEWTVGLRD